MYLRNLEKLECKDKYRLASFSYLYDVIFKIKMIAQYSVTDSYKEDHNGGEPHHKYEYIVLHQIDVILDKFDVAPLSEMLTVWEYHTEKIYSALDLFEYDEVQQKRFLRRHNMSVTEFRRNVNDILKFIRDEQGF